MALESERWFRHIGTDGSRRSGTVAPLRRNTQAAANGKPGLPSLTLFYSFSPKSKRNLRRVALAALLAFALLSILAIIVSMLQAGAPEFWHVWNWFSK